jgi:predicted restriction endonuclease
LSRALPNELERRFHAALASVQATEREATVRQRIGQNLFREGLMSWWGGRCAVTGLDVPALLRASHAKPWADSNDAERMDIYNGLLLAAHWDAAVDAGLVSLDVDGRPLWSPRLPPSGVELPCQGSAVGVRLAPRHAAYLAWHRDRVFQA